MSKQDGGPAFPGYLLERTDGAIFTSSDYAAGGMSLRDYFAGQALASFAGNEAAGICFKRNKGVLAKNCYDLADAMLKAREVKP